MKYNDLYNERRQKILDAIEFKNKNVLSIFQGPVTPAAEEGVSIAEYIADPEKTRNYFLHYMNRINAITPLDGANAGYPVYFNVALAMIWWSYIKMPGRGLPDNSLWQVEEKSRLEPSDYDFIAENGKDAMFQKLMPQLFTQEDLDKFLKAMADTSQTTQMFIDAGYPVMTAMNFAPPFETLCGGRGINNFFMDCYKISDKIKAAQDKMMESIRAQIKAFPVDKYIIGAWVGGWRGASAMVNQKIWDKLVWPYMKECAELLIEKGQTPIMHLDSCWDRDIERFKELPAKTIILNTDGMTDLRRAKKLLGDHAAFMGDVPAQMLAVSSKEEVADYVKRLIDDVGQAGLMICPGCDAPATAKFENMVAMYETAAKY
jgi:hypothetical protein